MQEVWLLYEIKNYFNKSKVSDWKMVMTEQYTPTINKEKLASGIFVYKDVIPSYEQLVPYIEQVTASGMILWERKEIGGNAVDTMTFEYPTELKDSNDISVLFDERMSLVLGGFLGFVESDYLIFYKVIDELAHDKMVLMKYGEGSEFKLSNNQDGGKMAVMYYLNDDYEGGSIHFPEYDLTYQPKANEALIFPAESGYEYSIEKITNGTKYSVLSYLR